ncbi:sensor histidine kinase [Streptomyces sp. SAI-229]|jgi:signal transduction histidine kinase|uniref:sensor histidine kinase n=1 Tax=Streptomyces sp. SAI-229 TaxID=3377731 RepID=UPI003C7A0D12
MELEFLGFARMMSGWLRLVVVSACAVLAVAAMPPADIPLAAAFAAVAIAWSVAYFVWIRSGRRMRLLTAVDLALVTGLCLSQEYTVPASQDLHGNTWILVTVSIVAVGYQLTHPGLSGALAALLVVGADLAGVVLDRPGTWGVALPNVLWLLVQSALSHIFYRLLLRRSRAADTAAASAAAARLGWQVAEARRVAEREHLATLHDTACATLLMASVPGSLIRPEVLRAQAWRDLERLAPERRRMDDVVLMELLSEEIAAHALQVLVRSDAELGPVWWPAATALRDSVGESLRNVARHAGVNTAEVSVRRVGHRAVVTVQDRGMGFDPADVPAHRQGLARSVIGRMHTVGGQATVESRPGEGTIVRLEWPRG